MKPPISYYGGKTTIAPRIADLLPWHLHYVEPFAGSLAVLLAKQPSRMETVNDLDADLITFWKILRARPQELQRACAMTPHSRLEYQLCRDADRTSDEVEIARRVWVMLSQGRGGTLRDSKTGWRHFAAGRGSSVSMSAYLDGYLDRIAPAADRLRHVTLECMQALDMIAKYGTDPDTLIYADPPYLGTTRGWGNNYRHEMKDESEHRELANALRAATAAVVLSGYPSDLYDLELYPDWHRVEIPTATGNGGNDRARTEVLWSNRPLGDQLTLALSTSNAEDNGQ